MTEFVHKGGHFIIQDDGQKGMEATYLALFTRNNLGEEWMKENGITTKISSECPDFLFKVPNNKIIGLEIVNINLPSENFKATARLNTIGRKVIAHFKEKGIPLSIIIDVYDSREDSLSLKDNVDYWRKPGFSILIGTDTEIKTAFILQLEKQGIPDFGVTKAWVSIKGQRFIVTATRMHEPHTSCHVNNMFRCIENPFELLQNTINIKNKKYESYLKNCDECDLLVVSDDPQLNFTRDINKKNFESEFRNIYLLDLCNGSNVFKLNLYKKAVDAN